ncbi:hypothetical protein ACTMU2_35220 [Cupriavidus basilensis]
MESQEASRRAQYRVPGRPRTEDLAATSVWGSQQVNMYPDAKFDGVFGMWMRQGRVWTCNWGCVQARELGRVLAPRRRAGAGRR